MPALTSRTLTLKEFQAEAAQRFGDDPMNWKFICPVCGYVASAQDYKDAGAPQGAIGFSCIGRYRGATCFTVKGQGPCDYTGGGLFQLNPVHLKDIGDDHPGYFELAPISEKPQTDLCL